MTYDDMCSQRLDDIVIIPIFRYFFASEMMQQTNNWLPDYVIKDWWNCESKQANNYCIIGALQQTKVDLLVGEHNVTISPSNQQTR